MSLFQLARGGRKIVHSGITATVTGTPEEAKDNNAMILFCDITGSGTWTIKIQVQSVSSTWMDMYDQNGNLMAISSMTSDKAQLFVGIPKYFRIVGTEDSGTATMTTIAYELFSV